MFANFGDKYYGNLFTGTWWYVANGWQENLAQTIAWGIEHNVYPYNHTWRHPHLDQLADNLIQPQLALNDEKLREYLALAGHPEFASNLSNYIALPYGSWPVSDKGIDQLTSYQNPEGDPVRAVFEAGYEYSPALPHFFHPISLIMHLPRMAAIPSISSSSPKPHPLPCRRELHPDLSMVPRMLINHGRHPAEISSGLCLRGLHLDMKVSFARYGSVVFHLPDY